MTADVENFLQGKPLIASGDSAHYRFKKLLNRNPLASMLTLVVVLFLIALPIFMYDASNKLKIQSDKATEQAEIANATTEFITTLLKSATPLVNQGEDLNMVDVMEQAEHKLLSEPINNTKVEIKLYRIFASIQHSLENNQRAIEHYQKAADLSAQIGDYEGQLSALGQKAVMYFFDNQVEQGNEAFRQADKVSKKVNNAVELAWHNLRKSTNEYTKGNYQLAMDLAQNALDEMQARNNTNPEILGRIYNELAIATSEFDMEASLPYRDEAIKYAEIFHGKLHPVYLGRSGNKIFSLLKLDRYEEAEVLLEKSMRLAEKLFSKDHPEYAYLLAKEAELHFKQGNYLKAEKSRIWGNDIFKKFKGEVSFQHVFGVNVLAEIYEYQGEYLKAKALYLKAIDIRTQLDPNNLIRIADVQSNLARLLVKMGDFEAAQPLIIKAIEVYQQYKKDNLYNHLTQVATLISDGSDYTRCQSGMQQITTLSPEILAKPETNWEPMLAVLWIGELAMKCGQKNVARTHLNSALKKSKLIYTEDSVGQIRIAEKVTNLLN